MSDDGTHETSDVNGDVGSDVKADGHATNDERLELAIYSFEALLPALESPPIAARRALDRSGLRLAVEAWRSLASEQRIGLVLAGAEDRVDTIAVAELVGAAILTAVRFEPRPDPNPATPPDALAAALDPPGLGGAKWASLRALDRYALVHVHRQAAARSAFSSFADQVSVILAAAARPRLAPRPIVRPARPATPRPPSPLASTQPSDPAPSPPALSSHLTEAGEVHMVDVGPKAATARRAVARGAIHMQRATLDRLASRTAPKGEVLATARLAGIMAAKRTHEIIPLCHLVALTHVDVSLDMAPRGDGGSVVVTATVDAHDRTGCEMEALVAVTTACLTVYDMLKGIDREMVVTDVMLLEKLGGRSGHYRRRAGRDP